MSYEYVEDDIDKEEESKGMLCVFIEQRNPDGKFVKFFADFFNELIRYKWKQKDMKVTGFERRGGMMEFVHYIDANFDEDKVKAIPYQDGEKQERPLKEV